MANDDKGRPPPPEGAQPKSRIDDIITAPGAPSARVPPSKAGAPPPVPEASKISGDASHASEAADGVEAWEPEPFPAIPLEDPRIGQMLAGRYRIDKMVGKGGMGRVYRATQLQLQRSVAIKILNPEFQRKDPQFVRRFFLEAASAARLSHPNTITVFDYGESESGELFIVMELLKGKALSKVISAEGPLPSERALHVGMQICRALREAHTKGIIHRDLKPGNILLLEEGDDADFVKVLDFGLVKLIHTGDPLGGDSQDPLTPSPPIEADLTKAGMFLGSPKYMSPEQIQGMQLDPRTDIYSLGVLMFQMVTGKPPFVGATSVEVIYKHVNQPVPTFKEMGVLAPVEVESLIRRMLAKRREDRFDSMAALLVQMKEVRRLLTGGSGTGSTADVDLSDVSDLVKAKSGSLAPMPVLIHPKEKAGPSPERSALQAHVAPRESSFADAGVDDTGSGLVPKTAPSRNSALIRHAPLLAGATLVLMLGVLAFVLTTRPATGPGKRLVAEDEGVMAPRTAKVALRSEPPGAQVFDRGANIGTTPLEINLPSAGLSHDFVFKKPGFKDALAQQVVSGERVEVMVTLEPAEAGGGGKKPKPKPAPGDEDYKENPY